MKKSIMKREIWNGMRKGSLLLLLGGLAASVTLVACGDSDDDVKVALEADKQGDTAAPGTAVNPGEIGSTGASGAAIEDEYAMLESDVYNVVKDVKTMTDAEGAVPKLDEIYRRRDALIAPHTGDAAVMEKVESVPKVQENRAATQTEITRLKKDAPEAGALIDSVITAHKPAN